jgi:DNA-binding transcriptional ArsR family regulator
VSEDHDRSLEAPAALFKALGSPLRLRILVELMTNAQCVHDLTMATKASQPLVSQHLRVLRQTRLVSYQKNGKEIIYSIADDHIAHIVRDALAHITEKQND